MVQIHTPTQFITAALLSTLLLLVVGCTDSTETDKADQDTADPGNGDFVLAENGIRLGMTMPDGRTLVGVIDLSALPAEGIRVGTVSEDQPEGCFCVCTGVDPQVCKPSPPGCPANCPQPFCSDGTFPPCNDSAVELPDLRALLTGPTNREGPGTEEPQ